MSRHHRSHLMPARHIVVVDVREKQIVDSVVELFFSLHQIPNSSR